MLSGQYGVTNEIHLILFLPENEDNFMAPPKSEYVLSEKNAKVRVFFNYSKFDC